MTQQRNRRAKRNLYLAVVLLSLVGASCGGLVSRNGSDGSSASRRGDKVAGSWHLVLEECAVRSADDDSPRVVILERLEAPREFERLGFVPDELGPSAETLFIGEDMTELSWDAGPPHPHGWYESVEIPADPLPETIESRIRDLLFLASQPVVLSGELDGLHGLDVETPLGKVSVERVERSEGGLAVLVGLPRLEVEGAELLSIQSGVLRTPTKVYESTVNSPAQTPDRLFQGLFFEGAALAEGDVELELDKWQFWLPGSLHAKISMADCT
ncbi:MAG: hypothetical protein ACRDI0_02320 [Actinomycetota bacterium]